jgi:hypothetical protein
VGYRTELDFTEGRTVSILGAVITEATHEPVGSGADPRLLLGVVILLLAARRH